MATITTIIPPISPAPTASSADFDLAAQTCLNSISPFVAGANALASEIQAVATEVASNATISSSATASLEAAVADAQTAATDAQASQTASAASEANSAASAATASTSATTATTKADEASASASAAEASQNAAATSEINSAASASTASTASSAAVSAATSASTSEYNASSAAGVAVAAAGTSTTQAGNAATSAENAATSETNAATSASMASDSEAAAATSATNAAASETAAAASAAAAAEAASGSIPDATADVAGKVLLATNLKMTTGDATSAVTPAQGNAAYAAKTHTHVASNVGLGNVTNDAQVKRSEMGVASGVATLGADGLVPTVQLPTLTSTVAIIRTPTITSPADDAVLTASMPTITCDAYRNVYGVDQASMIVEIATDSGFTNIIYTGTTTGSATSFSVPSGHIAASSSYYIGVKYTDSDGESSARGSVHVTTAAQLEHVTTPSITAPASGATVYEQPTLTSSAFAVSSGSDTHIASQWRAKTTAGTWDSPLWDSGTDTTNLTSITMPVGYITAGGNGYDFQVRHEGSAYGWSAWADAVSVVSATSFASIIGVACTATGGGGGTWAWIDSAGNAFTPAAGYFNSHPVFGGITDVTIDSQSMVKIPKFYVKRATLASGAYSGKEAWFVSDQPATGFHLHPAFYNAGSVVDQCYVGKYQASSDGSKLKSVSGVAPAVSTTLTAFQTLASARNTGGVTGFMLWSAYQWAAIQWLYLIENATMDSQTKTGAGRTSQSSAANVDASDVAQATYRGIVGLWGNVYQWLDGLKTDGTQICLWDNSGNKTWVTTGHTRIAAAGWIYPLTFMSQSGTGYNFVDVFIGDTGPTSNSGATAPDCQYFNAASAYFPVVGGHWGDGAGAGLWYVGCSGSASDSGTSIGARLAKV